MADCEFPITFHQPVDELIDRLRNAIRAKDGSFAGDRHAGKFSIPTSLSPVAGSYIIEDQVFHFVLTELPAGVSCHKADNTFRSLIGSPPDVSLDFT
ncbi:hypothetical protein GGR28_003723 [Lewinella aquimaris]|uniref:Uncharacterized protein n=1 Tax=Neolewinella aquimaris TaxID=1835722 RepID=A0A840EJM4_9BACT|nr:hypothetical protein [Neolewinella aquimaris]MBB4081076.1 hypothetical protein [Neolewinella aquimaris]